MTSRRRPRILSGVAALAAVLTACTQGAGSEEPTPDPEAFCARLGDVAELTLAFDQLDVDRVAELVPRLEEAVVVAPVEIGPDAEVVGGYARAVLDDWQAASPLDADGAAEAFDRLATRADAATTSGQALEAWARDECGVDLRSPVTTTTTIPTTVVATPTDPAGG